MGLKKLKAASIALLGIVSGGAAFHRKGRVIFPALSSWLRPILSLFFDVRQKGDGRIWFQLRDRKVEKRINKKISRILERK